MVVRFLLNTRTIKIDKIGPGHAAQLADFQIRTFNQAYSDVHSQEDIDTYCHAHYASELAEADLSSEQTVCCVGLLDAEPVGYYMVKHQACPIDLGFAKVGVGPILEVGKENLKSSVLALES